MVSTSNRALTSCADAKGEGDTHAECCVGLHVCKLQRYCHGMLCFIVGATALPYSFKYMWQVPRFPYVWPSLALSPTSFAIAMSCVWYSMALLKSPCDSYALPRLAYVLPSPAYATPSRARSPTSFAIDRR